MNALSIYLLTRYLFIPTHIYWVSIRAKYFWMLTNDKYCRQKKRDGKNNRNSRFLFKAYNRQKGTLINSFKK